MAVSTLEQYCGSQFWNSTISWYTDNPNLTPCFEKTVLLWIPVVFLFLFSLLDGYILLRKKDGNIPWNWRNISKIAICGAIVIASVFDLVYTLKKSMNDEVVYPVDTYTPFIKIITMLACIGLVFFYRKKGVRSSGIFFLFWFFLVLFGVAQFKSSIELIVYEKLVDLTVYSFIVSYILSLIIFILNFLSDLEPKCSEYPVIDAQSVLKLHKPCPEAAASFPSKLTFSWFDTLAFLGYRKPLSNSDLWSINYWDRTSEVSNLFEKHWQRTLKANISKTLPQAASFEKNTASVDLTNEKNKPKPSSILPALCRAFGPTFLFSAILKLVQDLLSFISPQILELLINFVKFNEPSWKGYLYATALLVTACFQTILLSQYFNKMMVIGLRIRTALISSIYKKALRLSNDARKETTVGEIVNLMSVDAQRFMDLTTYLNMIWSAPLQIGLALYFLWQKLGPSVLAGLAVMIIMIPVNGFIANRVKTLQIKQMKYKDERVKLMNEILSGIKVLKLYAWEPSFEQQVLKIRTKEMNVLKQSAYLNASTSFIWACAPFLVSSITFAIYILSDDSHVLDANTAFVALTLFNVMRVPMTLLPMVVVSCVEVSLFTFAVYVLIDDKNVLDANKAFVSLSLFNLLRFPLSMLPMMISNVIQTGVSIKRINKFMNSEELDSNSVFHNDKEENALVMENCSFRWGLNEPLILNNINLKIKPKSLVAVVGAVGTGKSSLISAFLGEMEKVSGYVNVKGSVAYVPQIAWIQNATLQDNILFGKPINKKSYHKVVEACALKPDLDMLPGGDQTEIGEKGINLSGGQKQRVSLARAVYHDSDIYYLDDPLSAVDSHVGRHIFESVIGPKGILQNKTRIFVTHGITYLPEVDLIVVLKDGTISESGTYKELLEKKGAFAEFLTQHIQDIAKEELVEIDDELKKQLIDGHPELERQLSRQKSSESETSSQNSLARRLSSSSNKSMNDLLKKSKEKDKLIEDEKAETGGVKWEVYSHYFRSVGPLITTVTIILNMIFQGFAVGSNIWLSIWSSDVSVNGTQDMSKRDLYLEVYGALGVGQIFTLIMKDLLLAVGGINAAVKLHLFLVQRLFHVPVSFYDITPIGRIINRCASDIRYIDQIIPMTVRMMLSNIISHHIRFVWLGGSLVFVACFDSWVVNSIQVDKSFVVFVFVLLATTATFLGALKAAFILHNLLLFGILRGQMSFFDVTPLGRVLNRFGKDLDTLDIGLPMVLRGWATCFFGVIGTLVVISYSTPSFIFIIIPIGAIYYYIQRFYVATSRQLKRLESVSRSPIYSHFGESVTGSSVIRAYNVNKRFIEESEEKVDFNQICTYPGIIANRWLAVRLEIIGNLIIFFSALFAVIERNSISAGLVGLSVSYSLQITQTLNWLVRMTAEVETNIVAVERIKEYGETPQEAPWEITPNIVGQSWPDDGKVEFKDFKVRYREGLDLVLKGLNFTIHGGEKVGIVGRTGAGKSSLTLGLFRIVEAAGGSIWIDGVDVSKLGLHALRSRLTIIPQDPVLFSGTLRMNLDPFEKYTDEQVWRALELAHLKTYVSTLPTKLQHNVSEGGDNLSVGQRQLICLARALLRKTKVLVLDEATAAVDLETDDLIQRTIRTEFSSCTVLTIAHRINTILDSDRVLLLDKGLLVEFDSPDSLLKDKNSLFYGMARDAGLVS